VAAAAAAAAAGREGGGRETRDERVIKSSEVNARRETLSDVGDRPPVLLLVLLQPPPVAITHRTPNTIQSSKPHVRDPISTRSQLFASFKARSPGRAAGAWARNAERNCGEKKKRKRGKGRGERLGTAAAICEPVFARTTFSEACFRRRPQCNGIARYICILRDVTVSLQKTM